MNTLIIDIETKGDKKLLETYLKNLSAPKNYKDEEKIKEWIDNKKLEAEKELALDQDYNEIACIGIKLNDEPAKIISLNELSEFIQNNTLITFNGKSFDLPVIIKNGIKQKIILPYKLLKEATKKYNAPQHIDLMELISFGGQWKSLDSYLQVYLGIEKTPIDFQTCTKEELEAHCIEDCENTYKLFLKFKDLC